MKRRYRSTGPDRNVREAVSVRAGFCCELCGGNSCFNYGMQIHHRRPRAMGGTDRADTNQPQNLLYVGESCHQCTESRRGDAVLDGALVSQCDDPARVAVLIHGNRWRYLTADGQYSDNPPEMP